MVFFFLQRCLNSACQQNRLGSIAISLLIFSPVLKKPSCWFHPRRRSPEQKQQRIVSDVHVMSWTNVLVSWLEFSHLFNIIHLRDIKLQHVLNTIFKSDCGTGTACAWADKFQLYCPILKALKDDITTIFLYSRPETQGTHQNSFCESCFISVTTMCYKE